MDCRNTWLSEEYRKPSLGRARAGSTGGKRGAERGEMRKDGNAGGE